MKEIEKKILKSTSELQKILNQWNAENQSVVFTNGCFDIIHPGHIHILEKAKSYGDVLIVGLNSNRSVKNLKGKSRPINSESDRIKILCSIKHVDHVIVFDEDTPIELIELINPNFLVKGGDYNKSEIVGADLVEKNGGSVIIIDLLKNYSTSSLIDRFKK